MVIKPVDGAGAVATFVLGADRPSLPRAGRRSPALIQPYRPGPALSASFLVGRDGRAHLIAVGRQEIAIEAGGRVTYAGGELPVPTAEVDLAPVRRAVESVPGLRGFVGVDFIAVEPTGLVEVIEINPRVTTSIVGLVRLAPPGDDRSRLARAVPTAIACPDRPRDGATGGTRPVRAVAELARPPDRRRRGRGGDRPVAPRSIRGREGSPDARRDTPARHSRRSGQPCPSGSAPTGRSPPGEGQPMTTDRWLAFDIGGANLKAAHADGPALVAPVRTLEASRRPRRGPGRGAALLPPADAWAITMTAELCDCFGTKAEGVRAILAATEQPAGGRPVRVWGTDGAFHDAATILERPRLAAASNWLALATVVARSGFGASGLLIDVGSTTTDLIPWAIGEVPIPPATRTDLGRLQAGALVYAGVRRTPLCALGATLAVSRTSRPP